MSIFTDEYSFKNFVVGHSNDVAYTCALEIAKEPGVNYNPLFIYGKTGTGKTHMMNAIGLYIKENNQDMNILYLTAEQFAEEIVAAIRNGSIEEMDKKYGEIDVLLIDEIQYIAGREKTQEEFFRIFNLLYSNDKQIVLASNIEPRRMQNLEGRIYSRFVRGIVVEIKSPDEKIKDGILNKYIGKLGVQLSLSVKEFILNSVTNVFEIEGLVNKLFIFAKLNNISDGDITASFAKEILGIEDQITD